MPSEFKIHPAKEVLSIQKALSEKGRISLVCTIVSLDRQGLSGIASDSAGEALLSFDEESFKKAREGMLARIFGKAVQKNNTVLINIEAIQSFDNSALGLYNIVRDLEAKNKVF